MSFNPNGPTSPINRNSQNYGLEMNKESFYDANRNSIIDAAATNAPKGKDT